LLKDWRLDLDAQQARALYSGAPAARRPSLSITCLSMPAGTRRTSFSRPSESLRKSSLPDTPVRHGPPHRSGSPHVHLVVKAMSEQGERLNIRKATLREWRQEFARHLREQGIGANATERAVRGQTQASKTDGIYRTSQRRESTYWRERAESVARELRNGNIRAEPASQSATDSTGCGTRMAGRKSDTRARGQPALAAEVNRFVERMPPPRTEKEEIAKKAT